MKIPSGVREVIGKRLNRLSPSTSRLLAIAACIGRIFELDILAELEVDKSEDDVLLALEEALAAHLIEAVSQTPAVSVQPRPDPGDAVRRDAGRAPGAPTHAHRRDARASPRQRRRPVLPQLAYHFSEAGPAEAAKALGYAERAGRTGAASCSRSRKRCACTLRALRLQQQPSPRDMPHTAARLAARARRRRMRGSGAAEPSRAPTRKRRSWHAAMRPRQPLRPRRDRFRTKQCPSRAAPANRQSPCCWRRSRFTRQTTPCASSCWRGCAWRISIVGAADEAMEAHRRAVALAREIGDIAAFTWHWPSIVYGIILLAPDRCAMPGRRRPRRGGSRKKLDLRESHPRLARPDSCAI